MKIKQPSTSGHFFDRFAHSITRFAGSTTAFTIAMGIILIWIATGPIFNYSDTWQLVINTGTTIITFLMVFLIQRSQNKDSMAVHLKLNELVASTQGSSNRLIDVESLSQEELDFMQKFFHTLAEKAKIEYDIKRSHSIEEAEIKHTNKYKSFIIEKKKV